MEKIRQELSDSNIGVGTFKQSYGSNPSEKQVLNINKEHIRRLLHKWGFSPKVPQKRRFVRTATLKKEKEISKKE